MGITESRVIDRYEIYDDRDDYDTCCGCGPWYGGPVYREARARWLPGFGSPRFNYFGPGGYAGAVIPGGASYRGGVFPVPPPSVVPAVPAVEVAPVGPVVEILPTGPAEVVPVITPAQPGYV